MKAQQKTVRQACHPDKRESSVVVNPKRLHTTDLRFDTRGLSGDSTHVAKFQELPPKP